MKPHKCCGSRVHLQTWKTYDKKRHQHGVSFWEKKKGCWECDLCELSVHTEMVVFDVQNGSLMWCCWKRYFASAAAIFPQRWQQSISVHISESVREIGSGPGFAFGAADHAAGKCFAHFGFTFVANHCDELVFFWVHAASPQSGTWLLTSIVHIFINL